MRVVVLLAVLALAACEGPSRTRNAQLQHSNEPPTGISISGDVRYGVAGRL